MPRQSPALTGFCSIKICRGPSRISHRVYSVEVPRVTNRSASGSDLPAGRKRLQACTIRSQAVSVTRRSRLNVTEYAPRRLLNRLARIGVACCSEAATSGTVSDRRAITLGSSDASIVHPFGHGIVPIFSLGNRVGRLSANLNSDKCWTRSGASRWGRSVARASKLLFLALAGGQPGGTPGIQPQLPSRSLDQFHAAGGVSSAASSPLRRARPSSVADSARATSTA